MKFWQKAFMMLLIVFVVTFNVSIVIVLHFTYKEELNSAREKAIGEAYFIMTSLTSDFNNLEGVGNLSIESKRSAFKAYGDYYKSKQVDLGLYKEESKIESNLKDATWAEEEMEAGSQKVFVGEAQDAKYMVVLSRLLAPYEDYKLCYAYDISALERSNHHLMQMAIGVDIGMSLLLGIILFIVLGKLTRPLSQLQRYTAEIAAGNYGKTIEIKGKDEIADLGKQFNEMSLKINEQMGMLQEENKKKQLLIDNMAHEFRTPLTSISGYAQYLMMAALSEEEKLEAIDYILAETERLQKLSQTILYMADLREGELEQETINVKSLIQHLQDLFSKQKHYAKVQLILRADAECIQGNGVMIESLLINLIENGMRACQEKGQVTLIIGCSKVSSRQQAVIQVIDNGVGMSKEEIQKIQEPFYRIDKARSRKMGGVGLGVTLCKQIVALHEGHMHYDSILGKGTKVTITWPNRPGQ